MARPAAAAASDESPDPAAQRALAVLVGYALVEPLAGERLRLHPLLRQYAAARLHDPRSVPPATTDALGDAALAYWLAYAEDHPGYEGMDALEAEAPGLMGAFAWAHDHAHHRDLLALANAIGPTLRVRGRRNDQLTMCEYAKKAADALEDRAAQRWAAHQLAVTQADLGRLAEARDSYARALDLARELGDPDAECAELHGLAELDRGRGLLEKARNGFERALALARELRDPTAELVEVHSLALIDNQTGRLDEARAGYERALALARELGDPAAERDEVRELAVLDRKTGQLEQARQGHLRALELSRQLQNPATEQIDVHDLAMLDAQTGQLAEARVGFTRALDLAWQLGDPAAKRNELHALAVLDTETGRLAEARAGFELALDLARELGDPAAEAVELVNLGLLLAQRMGEPEQGRTMIEHGLAICERLSTVYEIGQAHWFLASIDRNQGNRAAAVAHYREALRRFEQVQSPDAEDVRRSLRALGENV